MPTHHGAVPQHHQSSCSAAWFGVTGCVQQIYEHTVQPVPVGLDGLMNGIGRVRKLGGGVDERAAVEVRSADGFEMATISACRSWIGR